MTQSIYETLIALDEASAAPAATAAKVAGKGLSRFIPGVGLAAGSYDAYDRAKKGDYTGAALSGAAGLASLVPGVGTAAAVGLTGAQLARDYTKKTGVFTSDEEIAAAEEPNVILAKFNDNTLHKYTKVPAGLTTAQLNTRIKQDYPNKTISNIVKGKF